MKTSLYRISVLTLALLAPVVMLGAEEAAPEATPPAGQSAAERPARYDTVRLKAGTALAGNIIGYSSDSILMKVFGIERAYEIAGIEEIRTDKTDPDFLWTVLGAALRHGNVSFAINIAQRDKNLSNMLLSYPQFQETLNEYRRAGELLDKLLPAQAQTGAERDRKLQQIDDLDDHITSAKQIIANPYYYETATVTKSFTCPTCGGAGVVRWRSIDHGERSDGPGHSERDLRRCPNCQGLGQIAVSSVEEVQRRRDTNAEAVKIIGWRAERDKLSQAVTGLDKQLAANDREVAGARAAMAGSGERLAQLCRAIAKQYFPE